MKTALLNTDNNAFTIKMSEKVLDKNAYNKLIKVILKERSAADSVISIDLSDIRSLTAYNLSVLVYCKQNAEQKGVRMVLNNVSPILSAFFELTRMSRFFTTAPVLAH